MKRTHKDNCDDSNYVKAKKRHKQPKRKTSTSARVHLVVLFVRCFLRELLRWELDLTCQRGGGGGRGEGGRRGWGREGPGEEGGVVGKEGLGEGGGRGGKD